MPDPDRGPIPRRAPTSTLGYAILGLLATKPRTGYELSLRMRAPIGYMWTAQHSQIYPELARLAQAKLVRSTVIRGRGPRDTKRYRITAAGRRSLEAWADSPISEVMRSELMLRVRALWLVSPERARTFIEGQRQVYLDRLQTYAEEEADFARSADEVADPSTPEFFAYATLRYGLSRVTAAVDWCDWLLDQLSTEDLASLPAPRT
jgi:DNA-binding PadR family transcriptional regulator